MALMIGDIIKGLISPVTSIADKLVMDKDKYAELQFKKVELSEKRHMALLKQTTTPKIDAFVKLLMAFRDLVIPMFRPLGSMGMAVFAGYCITNGIEVPEYLLAAMGLSPIGWGYSRHREKTQSKAKA